MTPSFCFPNNISRHTVSRQIMIKFVTSSHGLTVVLICLKKDTHNFYSVHSRKYYHVLLRKSSTIILLIIIKFMDWRDKIDTM